MHPKQLQDYSSNQNSDWHWVCNKLKQNPRWVNDVVSLIGKEGNHSAPTDAVEAARDIIRGHCRRGSSSSRNVADQWCTTSIDADLLEDWRECANDPDHAVCSWLRSGAPAGLTLRPEPCGILPVIDDEPECGIEGITTDYDSFSNYAGVESDDTAPTEVLKHAAQGHVKIFETLEELRHFLDGQEPILNKIGIIVKQQGNTVKKRMILDTKQSKIKQASTKGQRVLLPRVLDAVMNGMRLLEQCGQNEHVDWFVLDYQDQMGLKGAGALRETHKYAAACYRSKLMHFQHD